MEHISFRRNGKEFEPTKAELKMMLDDHAHRLAILEKALELACEELMNIYCSDYCGISNNCNNCCYKEDTNVKSYIEQAKEMMKSE